MDVPPLANFALEILFVNYYYTFSIYTDHITFIGKLRNGAPYRVAGTFILFHQRGFRRNQFLIFIFFRFNSFFQIAVNLIVFFFHEVPLFTRIYCNHLTSV